MKCYVTFDVKTKQYSVPVFFDNDEEAKRAYAFTIQNLIGAPSGADKSLVYFKKDIQLLCIGSYDREEGEIKGCRVDDLGSLDSIFTDFKASYMQDLAPAADKSEVKEYVEKCDNVFNESKDEKDSDVVNQFYEYADESVSEVPVEKKISLKRKKEEI